MWLLVPYLKVMEDAFDVEFSSSKLWEELFVGVLISHPTYYSRKLYFKALIRLADQDSKLQALNLSHNHTTANYVTWVSLRCYWPGPQAASTIPESVLCTYL